MCDEEGQLLSDRARVVSTLISRFLQRDRTSVIRSANDFEYASSSPAVLLDPTGMSPVEFSPPLGETAPGTLASTTPFSWNQTINGRNLVRQGSVTVRTGVGLKTQNGSSTKGAIAYAYQGDSLCDCDWLQFLWLEVIIKQNGQTYLWPGTVNSTTGEIKATTNPASPLWRTDTLRGEARYAFALHSEATTGYDDPGKFVGELFGEVKLFGPNAVQPTSMVAVLHFETFLVCDGKAVFKVAWSSWSNWSQGQNRRSRDLQNPTITFFSAVPGAIPDANQLNSLNTWALGQTFLQQ